VSFTRNIEEDLARRDFTVNAISYSPTHGICDPFGGREDLKNRIIRAVGEPSLRFREDALRILRGLRFAATFGFKIEEETSNAIRDNAHLLANVSAERIWVELRKTMAAPHAYEVMREYDELFLGVMRPLSELRLLERAVFDAADPISRLLSLFIHTSLTDFDVFCRNLKTDSHLRTLGSLILASIGKYDLTDRRSITFALRDLGEEAVCGLINLEATLGSATDMALFKELISHDVPYRVSDLDISGSDLSSLGYRGREIGLALEALLTAVIEGGVENDKSALIKHIKGSKNGI
jgi:tRNA nucleotidyltransferase/poly(A) polymerase